MTSPAPDTGRTAEEMRETIARFWWDRVCPTSYINRWDEAKKDPCFSKQAALTYDDADALLSGPLAPILQEAATLRDQLRESAMQHIARDLSDEQAWTEIAHLRAENANLRDRVREAEGAAEEMRERCAREAERVAKVPARMIGGMRIERLPMAPRTPREIAAAIRDLPLSPEPQEAGDHEPH